MPPPSAADIVSAAASASSNNNSTANSNTTQNNDNTTDENGKQQQTLVPLRRRSSILDSEVRLYPSNSDALYSQSTFKGEQKSGRNAYKVTVEIQHVDLKSSFLCGYLHIQGLTDDFPDLCTFFEAEIIGPKYSFLTRKWEADENIDRQHWVGFHLFIFEWVEQ